MGLGTKDYALPLKRYRECPRVEKKCITINNLGAGNEYKEINSFIDRNSRVFWFTGNKMDTGKRHGGIFFGDF